MTSAVAIKVRPVPLLDYDLIGRGFGYFAAFCAVMSPLTREPLAMCIGGAVPWAVVYLIGTPTMPAGVLYLLLWQWLQIFARLPQTWIDGDTLSTGLYGPNVVRAYWYMLASVFVLAVVFRVVLQNIPAPTPWQRTVHLQWPQRAVLTVYIGATVVSAAFAFLISLSPGLAQVVEALSRLKVMALVMLFMCGLMTGQGGKTIVAVTLFEIGLGFTGFLSDFRAVFIYLGLSAIAARVRWKGSVAVGVAGAFALLSILALFWTTVKGDYRVYATQSEFALEHSQAIKVPLSERMAFLASRAFSPDAINFGEASYMLLVRLAYTDIFGSVIDVQEASPEPIPMRQWSDAIDHVFKPRIFFPEKPPLSDSDVYMRLARRFSAEEVRAGTSISVGYMAENFADMGFPGMLFGIAGVGLLLAGGVRILMSFRLPNAMREGAVVAFVYSIGKDGVEGSMPKTLGATVMFIAVFVVLNKLLFPRVVAWLDERAALAKAKKA